MYSRLLLACKKTYHYIIPFSSSWAC